MIFNIKDLRQSIEIINPMILNDINKGRLVKYHLKNIFND